MSKEIDKEANQQDVYPVHGGVNINGTVYAISVPDAQRSSAKKYGHTRRR